MEQDQNSSLSLVNSSLSLLRQLREQQPEPRLRLEGEREVVASQGGDGGRDAPQEGITMQTPESFEHDPGLEYGVLAPEIAADNMAREMANAQLKRVMEVPPPPPPLSCTERRIGGAGGGGGGGGGRTKESEEIEEQTEEQTELQMSKSREQQLLKDLAYHQEDLTPQIELRELSKEAVGRYVLISLQSSSALCDQHALKPFINMTKSCTMMRVRQDATQHLGAL